MRCLAASLDDEVLRFPFPTGEASLGSAADSDFVVRFPGISRRHARMEPVDGGLRLFDLNSKNGLWVDGRRVREARLGREGNVRIGPVTLSIEDVDPADVRLALQFPHPPHPPRDGGFHDETDSNALSADSGGTAALGLVRDVEARFRGAPTARPLDELVRRMRSVLGAHIVLVVSPTKKGAVGILAADGETPGEELLAVLREGLAGRVPAERTVLRAMTSDLLILGPRASRASRTLAVVFSGGDRQPSWKAELVDVLSERLEKPGESREVARRLPRGETGLVFPDGMVRGTSPALEGLLRQITRTLQSPLDVLLLGETGTGKELIARMIHASGPTSRGPFAAVNCAAIPSELLESELFGVRSGVATGVDPRPGRIAAAHGGTLLLDEIGEMPVALQPKLLRFLQEREVQTLGAAEPRTVEVRVISISNRDLPRDVQEGRFRADLFYRIRALQFHVPPLRDRLEDIPALVASFVERAARNEGKWVRGVSEAAIELLRQHTWPGNIRELKSEVQRAVLFCHEGGTLGAQHFRAVARQVERSEGKVQSGDAMSAGQDSMDRTTVDAAARAVGSRTAGAAAEGRQRRGRHTSAEGTAQTLQDRMDATEREAIREALSTTGGKRTKAARLLGISRQGLLLKLKRLFPGSESSAS